MLIEDLHSVADAGGDDAEGEEDETSRKPEEGEYGEETSGKRIEFAVSGHLGALEDRVHHIVKKLVTEDGDTGGKRERQGEEGERGGKRGRQGGSGETGGGKETGVEESRREKGARTQEKVGGIKRGGIR